MRPDSEAPAARRLPAALAVLFPLVLLSAAGAWLTRDVPYELSETAKEADKRNLAAPPSLVIVGNSKSGTDIDRRQLQEALELDVSPAVLRVPGSGAPAWYTLLEQRVYGLGLAPELVVVYGQLGAILHGSELQDSERRAIAEWVDAPSDLVASRILRRDPAGRARTHAAELREGLLGGARNVGLRLFFPSMSADDARAALDEFFTTAKQRAAGGNRVVPVAEARGRAMVASDEDPALGFLPEIVRLAHARGSRVVFVRAPISGTARDNDVVPEAVEARLYELINELGASWIDLHELDLPLSAYRDDMHMTRDGAGLLTAELAARMVAGNLLEGGVLPATPPLRARSVARTGTLPTLEVGPPTPEPGETCRWDLRSPALEPLSDTALALLGLVDASPVRLTVDGVALQPHGGRQAADAPCSGGFWHAGRDLRVSAALSSGSSIVASVDPAPVHERAGGAVSWVYPGTSLDWSMSPAEGGPVTVEATVRPVVGESAELSVGGQTVPMVRDGRVLRGRVVLGAQPEPWSIRIRAGADTWLVVHQLRVDTEDPHWLVGHGGTRTYVFGVAPEFAERPAGAGAGLVATREEVQARTGVTCMPVLEPTLQRECRSGNAFLPGWLLAGDRASVFFPRRRMAAHPLGVDLFLLEAAAFAADGATPGTLELEIVRRRAGEETRVWSTTATFPPTGEPTRLALRIEPPLSSVSPHELRIKVGEVPVLVTEGLFLEHEVSGAPRGLEDAAP